MAYTPAENFPELIESMKRAAAALRDADVPYMLGGGLAAWARGGPPTEHDVDFFVRPGRRRAGARGARRGRDEAGAAAGGLAAEGLGRRHADRPDLQPRGRHVDDGYFERSEEMEVAAQRLPVASLGDVLTTKLLALNEQDPDLSSVLELARSLREQIDWDFVRARTGRRRSRARSSRSSRSSAS